MKSLRWRALAALCLGVATAGTRAEVVLYENDFETAVGAGWSSTSPYAWGLETTPADDTGGGFLGYFGGNDSTTLALAGLPTGLSSLTLQFDAYLMWSWDGNDTRPADGVPRGPDTFGFRSGIGGSVDSEQSWTFSHGNSTLSLQTFCGDEPAPCLPTTGALARYTLGYRFEILPTEEDLGSTAAAPMDSVYHFLWTVAHDGSANASFTFQSTGLQVRPDLDFPYLDEAWGLDNVRVLAMPVPEPRTVAFLATGLALVALGARRAGRRNRC